MKPTSHPAFALLILRHIDLAAWLPLATLDLVQPTLIYPDALASGFTRRFYRTRLP